MKIFKINKETGELVSNILISYQRKSIRSPHIHKYDQKLILYDIFITVHLVQYHKKLIHFIWTLSWVFFYFICFVRFLVLLGSDGVQPKYFFILFNVEWRQGETFLFIVILCKRLILHNKIWMFRSFLLLLCRAVLFYMYKFAKIYIFIVTHCNLFQTGKKNFFGIFWCPRGKYKCRKTAKKIRITLCSGCNEF